MTEGLFYLVKPTNFVVWMARFELAASEFQARPSNLTDNTPRYTWLRVWNRTSPKDYEPFVLPAHSPAIFIP